MPADGITSAVSNHALNRLYNLGGGVGSYQWDNRKANNDADRNCKRPQRSFLILIPSF